MSEKNLFNIPTFKDDAKKAKEKAETVVEETKKDVSKTADDLVEQLKAGIEENKSDSKDFATDEIPSLEPMLGDTTKLPVLDEQIEEVKVPDKTEEKVDELIKQLEKPEAEPVIKVTPEEETVSTTAGPVETVATPEEKAENDLHIIHSGVGDVQEEPAEEPAEKPKKDEEDEDEEDEYEDLIRDYKQQKRSKGGFMLGLLLTLALAAGAIYFFAQQMNLKAAKEDSYNRLNQVIELNIQDKTIPVIDTSDGLTYTPTGNKVLDQIPDQLRPYVNSVPSEGTVTFDNLSSLLDSGEHSITFKITGTDKYGQSVTKTYDMLVDVSYGYNDAILQSIEDAKAEAELARQIQEENRKKALSDEEDEDEDDENTTTVVNADGSTTTTKVNDDGSVTTTTTTTTQDGFVVDGINSDIPTYTIPTPSETYNPDGTSSIYTPEDPNGGYSSSNGTTAQEICTQSWGTWDYSTNTCRYD